GDDLGRVVGPPLVAVVEPVGAVHRVEEPHTGALLQVGVGVGPGSVSAFGGAARRGEPAEVLVRHALPAAAESGEAEDQLLGWQAVVEVVPDGPVGAG